MELGLGSFSCWRQLSGSMEAKRPEIEFQMQLLNSRMKTMETALGEGPGSQEVSQSLLQAGNTKSCLNTISHSDTSELHSWFSPLCVTLNKLFNVLSPEFLNKAIVHTKWVGEYKSFNKKNECSIKVTGIVLLQVAPGPSLVGEEWVCLVGVTYVCLKGSCMVSAPTL